MDWLQRGDLFEHVAEGRDVLLEAPVGRATASDAGAGEVPEAAVGAGRSDPDVAEDLQLVGDRRGSPSNVPMPTFPSGMIDHVRRILSRAERRREEGDGRPLRGVGPVLGGDDAHSAASLLKSVAP